MIVACPACGSRGPAECFYEQDAVPIHSCVLVADRREAVDFPRGRIQLVLCSRCGFIWNVAFDAERMRYAGDYEETQAFSPHFRRFQTALVDQLIDRYQLRNKQVLEIGCGKGDFLVELCERGPNWGTGIDPSYLTERTPREALTRVRFLKDFYSERYGHLRGDFVCCRHTLEHIHNPLEFVSMMRRSLGDEENTIVCFELPDTERILREGAFWDIYHEHCSYFTLGSLGRLFRACGLSVDELYKEYDGQYLLIEGKPEPVPPAAPHAAEEPVEHVHDLVGAFRRQVTATIARWRQVLAGIRGRGQRAVLWGSGSKAVAYIHALPIRSEIDFVVDINPHKHGKYIAGSGHQIVGPDFLRDYQPDLVIAMNPIYQAEIQAELGRLGVRAKLLALGTP